MNPLVAPEPDPGPAAPRPGSGAEASGATASGATASGATAHTLAFVESPVQLLNLLEWAHLDARRTGTTHAAAHTGGPPPVPECETGSEPLPLPLPDAAPGTADHPVVGPSVGSSATPATPRADAPALTIVVLPPHDPMTRGQLRRMAELARDEGHTVQWAEARGGASAPVKTIASLARPLRRTQRIVIGDPFSRYVQLLLNLTPAPHVVVVDDGTATMEFVSQLARGERLTRWHRKGAGGPRAALFAPVSRRARHRLTPADGRRVEVFSSMPVDAAVARLGVAVTTNDFGWTRTRFGPPRLINGTDLVGTSLVETGVVDAERYLEAVTGLARTHGATRYFAHRRESAEKLHRVATEAGLQVVRPDLPLELVARRGPIGRTILSFPSTVVHTLPLALHGTGVRVAVCDVDPSWLTDTASPRAQGFLSGVTGTAHAAHRL